MRDINDIPLITQVAVFHNKRAFDVLVRKYQSPLRRFLLNLTLGDAQLADDLAQETFIKAYTHIGTFQGRSSFVTWLYRIACRTFYDQTRTKKQETELSCAMTLAQPPSTREHLRMDIYTALGKLNVSERTCVTLQLINGYSIDEIAAVTQMPSGTVKSHLARGKKKLADYLRQNGYDGK